MPGGLRRAVERGEDGLAWTYTRIGYTAGAEVGLAAAAQPGVAVGSTVVLPSDGGSYALYYLFPMEEEQQTLLLLRRVLLTAGVLLLLLVAGVALLVTRQVITPVRLARRVAERIASGRLEERMHVSRRGRHRPPGDVVQPDGRGAAVADPQAGRALPGAAHVRLRRLPRAAHAADHRADGR